MADDHGWEEGLDPASGRKYWHHRNSQTSRWDKPPEVAAAENLAADVAAGKVTSLREHRRRSLTRANTDAAAAADAAALFAAATAAETAGAAAGGPSGGWMEHHDPTTGKKYWHHSTSGESSWEDPTVTAAISSSSSAAASAAAAGNGGGNSDGASADGAEAGHGWQSAVDPDSGHQFWHHPGRRQSSWEEPEEVKAARAAELKDMAAGDDPDDPWDEHWHAESGRKFYVHKKRGHSVWEKPAEDGGSSGASTGTDWRAKLVSFYEMHRPEKLANVDSTLAKYGGREELLFKKLDNKYGGVSPPPPHDDDGDDGEEDDSDDDDDDDDDSFVNEAALAVARTQPNSKLFARLAAAAGTGGDQTEIETVMDVLAERQEDSDAEDDEHDEEVDEGGHRIGILGSAERQDAIIDVLETHLKQPEIFAPACTVVAGMSRHFEEDGKLPAFTERFKFRLMGLLVRGMKAYAGHQLCLHEALDALHPALVQSWHVEWLDAHKEDGVTEESLLAPLVAGLDAQSSVDPLLITKILWVLSFLGLDHRFVALLCSSTTSAAPASAEGFEFRGGKDQGFVSLAIEAAAAFEFKHGPVNLQLCKFLDHLLLSQIHQTVMVARQGVLPAVKAMLDYAETPDGKRSMKEAEKILQLCLKLKTRLVGLHAAGEAHADAVKEERKQQQQAQAAPAASKGNGRLKSHLSTDMSYILGKASKGIRRKSSAGQHFDGSILTADLTAEEERLASPTRGARSASVADSLLMPAQSTHTIRRSRVKSVQVESVSGTSSEESGDRRKRGVFGRLRGRSVGKKKS